MNPLRRIPRPFRPLLHLLCAAPLCAGAQDPCGAWKVISSPSPSSHVVLTDVRAFSADDAWAVGRMLVSVGTGFESHTLAMRWNGASWNVVPTPNPSPYPGGSWCELLALDVVSPNEIWAAGTQRIQGPDGYLGTQILVQRWNGASWSVIPAPMSSGGSGNFVDDLEVIAPDDVWFVGDWLTIPPTGPARKEALTMHWNGSSFSIVPAPFFNNDTLGGHGLTAVSAVASDDVWAVGGGHDGDYVSFSYIVHWDGSQWEHRPGPTAGWFHRLHDVEAVASDDVYAVGDYQDASGYHGLFLHWNGSSWTRLPDPPVGGSALEVAPDGRVYIGGAGVVVWDGAGFVDLESFPAVVGPSVQSIEPIGPCAQWAVGRRLAGNDLASFTARIEPSSDSVGNSYCAGLPNSTGSGASITATGSASIQAADLVLHASSCPPVQPGLFFYGTSQVQLPLGNGLRCVGGNVFRLAVVTTTPQGVAAHALDYDAPPQPAGRILPGSTWHFQYWYRDPQGGGARFNLSDARSIHFAQ